MESSAVAIDRVLHRECMERDRKLIHAIPWPLPELPDDIFAQPST